MEQLQESGLSSKEQWALERSGKYLTFRVDSEYYGIEILKVREIIGMIQVTRVPRMPDFVKGVVNLRGKVIPVIDLRLKFGLDQGEQTRLTCIVVVEVSHDDSTFQVGTIVDEVDEVIDFSKDSIEPAPEYGTGIQTDYIRAMGKVESSVKILLDIDKVITHSDVALFEES